MHVLLSMNSILLLPLQLLLFTERIHDVQQQASTSALPARC